MSSRQLLPSALPAVSPALPPALLTLPVLSALAPVHPVPLLARPARPTTQTHPIIRNKRFRVILKLSVLIRVFNNRFLSTLIRIVSRNINERRG
ncbi:hypothetical protein BDR05DRAFT_957523 [Suillus weaverae]|nr:hypothetical protein BDR05DRAFT_957523 [Suillus weaverae]